MSTKIDTTELCSYGCGNIAQYLNKSNNLMCSNNSSKCPVIKTKNSNALKSAYKEGRRVPFSTIYETLPQQTKDKMNWNKNKYNADFSYNGIGSHKKVLIQERGHKCESCNLTDWLGEPIPLELEHCDGDNKNNVKENLLLLCPNCHAKTTFYRGRNMNSGKLKVTDEQIINEINKGLNNRQVLINVGLTPKGGNYSRVNDLRYAGVAQGKRQGA